MCQVTVDQQTVTLCIRSLDVEHGSTLMDAHEMLQPPHSRTPTLISHDPRGQQIRSVLYRRCEAGTQAQAGANREVFSAAGHRVAQWDSRFLDQLDAGRDTPANQRSVHGLSGTELMAYHCDSGWRTSLFGDAGQPLARWDSKHTRQRIEHDALLRPTALHERREGASEQCIERFDYGDASDHQNRCGRLVRHDDPVGSLFYDDYAQRATALSVTRRFLQAWEDPDWPTATAAREPLLEAHAYTSQWRYDACEGVLEQQDAQGNRQRPGYGIDGQLAQLLINHGGVETLLLSQRSYDAQGQLIAETNGNGMLTSTHYSPLDGRLQRIVTRAKGETLQDLNYAYDPVGNVIRVEDRAQSSRWFANTRVQPVSTFNYDSLYQLIQATGRENAPAEGTQPFLPRHDRNDDSRWRAYVQYYQYDRSGNLTSLRHVPSSGAGHTRHMAIDPDSNRSLIATDESAPPPDFELAFDRNGNQRERVPGLPLQWNQRDQLQGTALLVRGGDGSLDDRELYGYGSDGRRARKLTIVRTGDGKATDEVRYLPGLEIRVSSRTRETLHVMTIQAGRTHVRAFHWQAGRPPDIALGHMRYSLANLLGSCSLEVDENADTLGQEEYYPFGGTSWWRSKSALSASYKSIGYCSKERDASGFYYYGLRYYAPCLLRWINPDPAGDVDGQNRYRFGLNNPTSGVDSQGLKWTTEMIDGISVSLFDSEDLAEPQQIKVKTSQLNLLTGNSDRYPEQLQPGKLNVPDSLYSAATNKKHTILSSKVTAPESCIQSTEFLISYMAGDHSPFDFPGEANNTAAPRSKQVEAIFDGNQRFNVSTTESLDKQMFETELHNYFRAETKDAASVGEGIILTQTLKKRSPDPAEYSFHFMAVTGVVMKRDWTIGAMIVSNLAEPIRTEGEELEPARNWQPKLFKSIAQSRPANFLTEHYSSGWVRAIPPGMLTPATKRGAGAASTGGKRSRMTTS